jgi:hypothetical protein
MLEALRQSPGSSWLVGDQNLLPSLFIAIVKSQRYTLVPVSLLDMAARKGKFRSLLQKNTVLTG